MARKSISNTGLGARLSQIRELAGYESRKSLALELQINPETLGGYERGDTVPDHDFLTRYHKKFAVDLNWLITGEGAKLQTANDFIQARAHANTVSEIMALQGAAVWQNSDFIPLPKYTVEASAGPGISPGAEVPVDVVAFDRQFLRDRGASPDQCTVIRARGDSMVPTIPDGSLLVVDHSQREISNGYITVIAIGDDLLVKRIRRRLDGMVELISDNPTYAPELIATDRLEQLRIVGRVVYFCRVP